LLNNLVALIITFALAIAWLRVNDFTAHRGWVSGSVSRKIIHIGTGPIFVLCWLLFNNDLAARFLAALIPLAITAQFFLVGSGIMKDQAAVEAMSRTGDRREILRGPLFYGIAFVILTVLFWRDTAIGIIALMVLCGGDGLADIVGKRFGTATLPWSKRKTWAGSVAMFLGSWILAAVIISIFLAAKVIPGSMGVFIPKIGLIALAAAVVESFPAEDIDNITVPVISVLLGLLIF
jgi:phytol kinase